MAAINTNVSSLIAQRVLGKNNKQLNQSLQRLSTGLKINTGADNPAGLIASENLRAEKTGITAALNNAERAGNVVATAEGGLAEVQSLLNEVQGLVTETANSGGLSKEEVDANQSQIDAILGTINRLSGSVNFQGKKLLNGEQDYVKSGADLANLENVKVNSAKVGDDDLAVNIDVASAAELATYTLARPTAATEGYVLEVAGNEGTAQLSFLSGATSADIIDAVNAVSDQTGVTAVASGGIQLKSAEYGSSQFVSVKSVSGAGVSVIGRDDGKDAVVTVNGSAAETDGRNVSFRSSNLDVEFDLNDTSNAAGAQTFDVTGGGATFSLGSKVTTADKVSLGIASVSTSSLGLTGDALSSLASGGANSLKSDNLNTAQKVVDAAVKQVAQTRGRLGSFQKFVVNSTVNQLGVAFENASAAESAIRDTDFASETAALTRAQILSQASASILSQANAQPQQALQLLQ